jgi:reverse gyrase
VSDLTLHKLNEVFIKIDCERHFAQELNEYFSFRVPGFQFTPAYKNKLWDGFIRLFSLRDFTIYHGLLPYIEKFCRERDYIIKIDPELTLTQNFSVKEATEFIKTLNLPLEVRDYQLKSFVNMVRNKRMLLVSPTGSGKSLIQYLIVRWLQESDYKRGLLIVPTTSLVEQMFKDFQSYGYDSEKYCHRQYSGKEKHTNQFLTITTWQSVYKNDPEYFEQFDFVLGDECLHPNTNIKMADNTNKKIKNIKVGDYVKTFNEKTKQIENKKVIKIHENLSIEEDFYEIQTISGNKLKITGNHKVLLKSGVWKEVKHLKVGDIINSIE